MTKSHSGNQVGDSRAPTLLASKSDLRQGVDQAEQLSANHPEKASTPSRLKDISAVLNAATEQKGVSTNCKQNIWISFFFDGTGNNLEADIDLQKHSNIARLYRAHKKDNKKNGIYSVYIPGIGTYFPEIGDDGGSTLGLVCAAKGEERLDFAIEKFDNILKEPLARANAPINAIQEINIAVFGFSRGAALARVFLNRVMDKRCKLVNNKWILVRGEWSVRFRFLGLFDTVASVGLSMSSNTTGLKEAYDGNTAGMIKKRLRKYQMTRPEVIAFNENAVPGADPAPGDENGHRDWGKNLMVRESVEEVRHFIAAHEIRNSFPVDSISIFTKGRVIRPSHFFETLYPGVHSDVGGGYAPGEGGRSIIPTAQLCLIPLNHMYQFALQRGVPMLPRLQPGNEEDFRIDPELCKTFNYYLKDVGSFATLGEGFNKHMKFFYAWRFMSIRRKAAGDKSEAKIIRDYDNKFSRANAIFSKEVDALTAQENMAQLSLNALVHVRDTDSDSGERDPAQQATLVHDLDVEKGRQKYSAEHDKRLRAQARKDALPNMTSLQDMLNLYERQLMLDTVSIRVAINNAISGKRIGDIRPHYKALMEAYEDEFLKNRGLKDANIIALFENHVHDSLAGFGKDATLPSDPRVVYLGGDEKYGYASSETQDLLQEDQTRLA
ncbi:T6SS phospholipase effector Tle1-like catalytic domain-containing protein [Massilia phyllosphaerae]|uniref:T6SS phospholipase effector Tle1-like catalytic domain-containing protein n=1 Tax=Massilia phyllosphaerae TaxID=3106034 RepID=UPI002B1CAC23|nr:DUF2235 domain-containing protein [Massilia sp. SGZ-792]